MIIVLRHLWPAYVIINSLKKEGIARGTANMRGIKQTAPGLKGERPPVVGY